MAFAILYSHDLLQNGWITNYVLASNKESTVHPNELICTHRSRHHNFFLHNLCVFPSRKKHIKLACVSWFHSQIRLVEMAKSRKENSAFSENLKKKIQSIWKIDSHFTFGVYYEHTDLTLHSETTHLAVSQWTHLFVSELNFWVNSTCCESVNSTFVNQLNLLWANSQLVESA